jgi:hypothetical protein
MIIMPVNRVLVLVTLFILAGCGSNAKLYGSVGIGYKVNGDQLLMPEYSGGRNPTAHFEIGYEWPNGVSCGINHWSHWRDGTPFNDNPETYKDEVVCRMQWGGQ